MKPERCVQREGQGVRMGCKEEGSGKVGVGMLKTRRHPLPSSPTAECTACHACTACTPTVGWLPTAVYSNSSPWAPQDQALRGSSMSPSSWRGCDHEQRVRRWDRHEMVIKEGESRLSGVV